MYNVYKSRGAWRIAHIIDGAPHEIASFKTKKQAVLTARLLAGARGTVTY